MPALIFIAIMAVAVPILMLGQIVLDGRLTARAFNAEVRAMTSLEEPPTRVVEDARIFEFGKNNGYAVVCREGQTPGVNAPARTLLYVDLDAVKRLCDVEP